MLCNRASGKKLDDIGRHGEPYFCREQGCDIAACVFNSTHRVMFVGFGFRLSVIGFLVGENPANVNVDDGVLSVCKFKYLANPLHAVSTPRAGDIRQLDKSVCCQCVIRWQNEPIRRERQWARINKY